LASISRKSLIIGVGRARAGAVREILNVVLSIEESLLLGRATSSIALGNTTEPAGNIISELSATISLVLLLGVGFVEEKKANNDSNENSGGAEEVGEKVGVSVPDGSTGEDLGVTDAWSCQCSSNHRSNNRSK
jgi:hypothetical protein